jgi:hypothetical protein
MLMEEDNIELVQILDKKLADIEQEHRALYNKLLQEKEIIKQNHSLTDEDFHSNL